MLIFRWPKVQNFTPLWPLCQIHWLHGLTNWSPVQPFWSHCTALDEGHKKEVVMKVWLFSQGCGQFHDLRKIITWSKSYSFFVFMYLNIDILFLQMYKDWHQKFFPNILCMVFWKINQIMHFWLMIDWLIDPIH